jgi:hypothetical protein
MNCIAARVTRVAPPACVLLAAVSFCAALVRSQSGSPRGTWTTKTPLPTKRFEMDSVTLGDKIYMIARESNGILATKLITEYDPATNHWRELAPIPHVTLGERKPRTSGRGKRALRS